MIGHIGINSMYTLMTNKLHKNLKTENFFEQFQF
jgi:hypothetical protein